jgi:hypothetical protein
MIGQWKAFLQDHAAKWNLPGAGDWSFLLHNNYHPHCSNLNLLWFHNGARFPYVVTKAFHDESLPKREFENLQYLYARVPALVPRPLHFGLQAGWWTLWMEGVPGLRFGTSSYNPATLRSLVQVVAKIHGAVRNGGNMPGPGRYQRTIIEPLQTVAEFGMSSSVRAGCADIAATSSEEWLNSLPSIPQHGDLFSSNILSNRERWWVLDWESFGIIDLPFYDLFTLLFSLLRTGAEYTPEQWDGSMTKHVPALIASYAEALGMTTADVPRLLPLTLANWFHLQWRDGRKEFTEQMYKAIRHYFEHPGVWNNAFLPTARSSGSQ